MNEIRHQIREFIAQRLLRGAVADLRDTDSLSERGALDSVNIAALAVFLEASFGIVVKGDEWVRENFDSVQSLCGFVGRKAATLGRVIPAPTRPRPPIAQPKERFGMLVQDFLEDSARRLPDKVALVVGDQRVTYREIDERANRLANALAGHGIQRGDRVAIFLPNSVEAVIGIFGILKAGAVFVPVNATTKRDKLAYILGNCRASALLLDLGAGEGDFLVTLEGRVPSLRLFVGCGEGKEGAPPVTNPRLKPLAVLEQEFPSTRPAQRGIDVDLACLIYTSGSTGDPKGVISDHSNVVFASQSIITYLGSMESDVVLNVLPLAFDYGLYQLLMTFRVGGTLVLEKSFAFPVLILRRMEQERVTGLPGVPTIFAILVQMDLSPYDLSSLRYVSNTAAALPPSHIVQIQAKFSQARLFSMYGLTETKRTLYLPPEELLPRPGSVGIPIPGTEAWVCDEAGNRLGPNLVGELVVRGRHVMRGYWEDPVMTERRFKPGLVPGERLCYTGDLFRIDEAGYFYFVGRKDDIIKTRGEKVAPKEVENVLYAMDGVLEAAVVPVPDPILGQAVKAFLVVRDTSLTAKSVMAHCRAQLEDFMVPKFVEFRSELPKTSTGKIKKTDLA